MDWRVELERGCAGKVPLGKRAARSIAEQARREGNRVTAYRCPWAEDGHWHTGHVPSMQRVEQIADAIRQRAQDPAA